MLFRSVLGTTLAVVFMLAHCVEEAEFPELPPETERLPRPWAVHQVETTVDFAGGNRLLTWYVGGLNFQVEHHLFPKVCSVHYPALSRIVRDLAAKHDLPYNSHATMRAAIRSHLRTLHTFGRTDPAVSGVSSGKSASSTQWASMNTTASVVPRTSDVVA